MSPVGGIGLLTVEPEGLHHWRIREGKERRHRGLGAVGVFVAGPGRHSKDISLFPGEAFPLNDTPSRACQHQVDATAGLPMRLCVDAGAKILCRTTHGREDWTTGIRVGVLEEQVIVGSGGGLWECREGCRSAVPLVIQ